jgi:hypothetical protein
MISLYLSFFSLLSFKSLLNSLLNKQKTEKEKKEWNIYTFKPNYGRELLGLYTVDDIPSDPAWI